MWATCKLLNAYFWKTYYGPILSFIFPVILLGIFGHIFKIEYVYPGIIAMAFLFIGLLSLPLAILELKQSSLFKYIGSSPVNPIKFTIVVIGFYIFTSLISAFFILLTTMTLFYSQTFNEPGGFKNGILGGIFMSVEGVFSFYISTGIHLVFVIVLGLLIATFSKTPQQALTVGLVIIIPSIFLSGMIVSVDIIAQYKVLNWFSRFVPFRYSTGNMIISATPLPQTGDMFQDLNAKHLRLIFENVNIDKATGEEYVWMEIVKEGKSDEFDKIKIFNMNDLTRVYNDNGLNLHLQTVLRDKVLFDLTFGNAIQYESQTSSNNIFDYVHSWSVRRVATVSSIKEFIKKYFAEFSGKNKEDVDLTKLQDIFEQITQGDFGWLKIFLNQTNVLYTSLDRILNMWIPIASTACMIWYITLNFNWSVR